MPFHNLNHLRVFISVYRHRSMTEAAKDLHLTQSGISQHIKGLEEELGLKLFDRIHRKVIPTQEAEKLYEQCTKSLREIEQTLEGLQGRDRKISGHIRIGLPIEFGNNIILPLLAEFVAQHPEVSFSIRYDFAYEHNRALLRGRMDFAFVDAVKMDSRIELIPVYDEILELCIAKSLLKKIGPLRNDRAFYEKLPYVDYQPDEPILRMWFTHHLHKRKIELDVKVHLMDVRGLATLISNGVGAGILPHYFTEIFAAQSGLEFAILPGCGKPLKNRISIATLEGKTLSPAALALKEFLQERLKG